MHGASYRAGSVAQDWRPTAPEVCLPHGTGRWMCRPWRQCACRDDFACERRIPGDTARPFAGVWGAPRPRITPSTLICVPDFGPQFRPICHFQAGVFGVWRWNDGVACVLKGIGGCPRIPPDLPRPLYASVGPSYCMAHHTVRAPWPKIVATGRPGSLPSPWHAKVDVLAMAAVRMRRWVCL